MTVREHSGPSLQTFNNNQGHPIVSTWSHGTLIIHLILKAL